MTFHPVHCLGYHVRLYWKIALSCLNKCVFENNWPRYVALENTPEQIYKPIIHLAFITAFWNVAFRLAGERNEQKTLSASGNVPGSSVVIVTGHGVLGEKIYWPSELSPRRFGIWNNLWKSDRLGSWEVHLKNNESIHKEKVTTY